MAGLNFIDLDKLAAIALGTPDPKAAGAKEGEGKGGAKLGPAEPIPTLEIPNIGEMSHYSVMRPRLNQRNGVFWVTARSWDAPARLAGMSALAKAKDELNADWLASMSTDLGSLAVWIHGAAAGAIVTAPAARHSAFLGIPHFAGRVAELIAMNPEWGLEHRTLFAPTAATHKGHHPRREKDPPKLAVDGQELAGARILLIDDVVTSGKTLEEHYRVLRASGAHVSVLAWVYGAVNG